MFTHVQSFWNDESNNNNSYCPLIHIECFSNTLARWWWWCWWWNLFPFRDKWIWIYLLPFRKWAVYSIIYSITFNWILIGVFPLFCLYCSFQTRLFTLVELLVNCSSRLRWHHANVFFYSSLCPHLYWWQERQGTDPPCSSWQVESPCECSLQIFHHGQLERLINIPTVTPIACLHACLWTWGFWGREVRDQVTPDA